ncbi:hypothetical protein ACQP2E_12620 [Actinoplanes sp. CA-015351]|uniref:hypothetical protein n=1 Tax=Actinoplanes sp. CA-015351 TaxID=3239897 RepID=UPI003D9815AE
MRRHALLAVLLALAATGACTDRGEPAPTAGPPAPAPVSAGSVVYAFEDANAEFGSERVFLVRDGTIVTWMPGSSPAFTADGRYLVTSTSEKTVVMDVATGVRHERTDSFLPPLGCAASQSLVGDSVIIVAPTLQRLGLPGLAVLGPVAANLPPRYPACVVGAVDGDPIVLVSNRHGWQVFRIGPDGTTRQIGPDPIAPPGIDSGMEDVQLSFTGTPRLAYREANAVVVHVLDLESGLDTVPSTAALGIPGSAESVLEDLWWSSAGVLHATFTIERHGEPVEAARRGLWRVVDGAWEPVNTAHWDRVRELPGGRRLVLSQTGTGSRAKPALDGLYEDGPGGARLIARNVGQVVVPPRPVPEPPSLSEPLHSSPVPTPR